MDLLRIGNLYSPKIISIIMFCMILAVIFDISITRLYYINIYQILTPQYKIIIFFSIGLLCLFGQFLFIKYINKIIIDNYLKQKISFIYKSIFYSQLILAVIFVITIIEVVRFQSYHTIILIVISLESSILSSIIMGALGRTLLKWYQMEKNIVLILYGLAFFSITLNIVISGCMTVLYLLNTTEIISGSQGFVLPYYDPDVMNMLNIIFYISSISGFTLAWISTIVMLRQYSIHWKNKMHWLLVSLPMIYFVIQYNPILLSGILNLMELSTISYAVFYTLFVAYAGVIGGIIFGAAFWTLTKILERKGIQFEFPRLAGYGFLLLLATNQLLILTAANFPPFGFITVSLLPLACSLLFIGIYSSALTVSFDVKLKEYIRNLVNKKSNMLLSMSSSEAIFFLEKQVSQIYNQVSNESSGVGTVPSLTIEEAKNYMINELLEVRKSMEQNEN